jgi:hypothetical protein
MSKWKDHRGSIAAGAILATASLASAVAITALMGIGTSIFLPMLITVVVAATAVDGVILYSKSERFRLGTCIGATAVTAGTLMLAFNAFVPAAEQDKKPPAAPQPRALVEKFSGRATRPDKTATAYPLKISFPQAATL